jgi:class 3 adenylate cyclase
LVSESTYALLKRPSHDLVDAGEIAIRGREQGMRVWGLRGPEPAPEGEAEKPEGSLA